VTIEAHADKNSKGKARKKGSTTWTFDAKGFGPPPDCDPNRKPNFKLEASVRKAEADADAAEDDGGSKRNRGGGDGDAEASGEAKGSARFGKPAQPGGG
jgi:hypothetical protein